MDTAELVDRGSSIADRLTTTQAAPQSWLVLGAAAVALVLVGYGPLWRLTRNVVTIAHEGGHALVALLTGRRLTSITLHSDTSGLTVSSGKPYGLGMICTALAGYPAPALLGLGFAALLGANRITLMLWIAIAALAAMLIMVRNVYGVVSVFLTGALVFGVSWFGSDTLQAGFAYLATWLLLLAGIRPVIELQRTRSGRRSAELTTDADQLARLTRLPGLLWVLVFAAISLGALALGAGLLLSATAGICLPVPSGGACPAG
ncbi:M50 family metallopeptidase [Nocardia cyriacigeorgica]|uniref:M50 family metallopeptidase n=1 Tax=Nocardia cyriacigeorgica TaxID=135487 RepID=UPI001893DA7D|nr:M50 family metallopeptidase [Nocardia cyriacigeorgica]MBF6480821.1 M50 family metallopeptidase [Nocardia cyriacigeorgica]